MVVSRRILSVFLVLIIPGIPFFEKGDTELDACFTPNMKEDNFFITGYFTENIGQWDSNISFLARTDFGRIGIGKGSVYLEVITFEDMIERNTQVLKYNFPGSENIIPSGIGELDHTTNYFVGNDPDGWITGVKSYEKVIYENVWNGIDIVYRFGEEGLKYDLVLHPGSSVEDVRIRIEGHDRILTYDGLSLTVNAEERLISDQGLNVFYEQDENEKIDANFLIYSEDTYGFALSRYSSDEIVIIDPLITSTYFGGSGSDKGLSVDLDSDGNIIMAGCTSSSDFPLVTGSYQTTIGGDRDYFISKFNEDGSNLIFSTYIGGSADDGYYDNYIDVVEDGILMAGTTRSSDFPTTTGCYDSTLDGYNDLVFLKLGPEGDYLIFSSYLGGGGSYDISRGILQSSDGDFFVYGYTYSSDFPTTQDAYMRSMSGSGDGFISKFNHSGDQLVYSTFFGGTSIDNVYHLLEDSNNDIIVAGTTYSSDFPTTPGAYSETISGHTDCYVTRFNSTLSEIISSTYFGGSSAEKLYSMIIDDGGNIVLVGDTYSSNFPVSEGVLRDEFEGYSEGYVISFKSDLSDIMASTFIGGDSSDTVNCIETDPFGNYMIAGYTSSSDMNTTIDAHNSSNSGYRDGFVSILQNDLATLDYSTYYGGSSNDSIMGRIAMDPGGKAVFTGYTSSGDLPVLDPYQESMGGSSDCFLFILDITPWLEPLEVNSLKLYEDRDYHTEGSKFDIGQNVYIEMAGVDANTSVRSGARVVVEFSDILMSQKEITLLETQVDSGIHRGSFRVPVTMRYFDTIRFSSWMDPSRQVELLVDYPYRPFLVNTISVHTDRFNISTIEKMDMGQKIFLRVKGTDSNPSSVDKAFLNLSSERDSEFDNPLVLIETGLNTGEFYGNFEVPVSLNYFENVTFQSVVSPSVQIVVMVHTPVQIRPLEDLKTALEDEEYRVHYWNFGYETETWNVSISSDWLVWDSDEKLLHGTPNNNHIYPCDVRIEIKGKTGRIDKHEFRIEVINTPPVITTENILFVKEGSEYYVDYNSSDDGQGDITWSVIPDNSWFSINKNTGILTGTPNFDDAGKYNVSVIVNDGNDGIGYTTFMLTVINVNQPPVITSTDITTGRQGERYQMNYKAWDPDGEVDLFWELRTDANFLVINNHTGELFGVPGNTDVGTWTVNVTVMDSEGLIDSHNFLLTIENVNDKPIWGDIPDDIEVVHGRMFTFDVNATDPDVGDELEFSVWTSPESDLVINRRTGVIEWIADYTIFDKGQADLEVNIRVSDNSASFTSHTFIIKVIPTRSPVATLMGPVEGGKASSKSTILSWEGTDPEEEPLTYWVYVSEERQFVDALRDEALHVVNYNGTDIELNDLEEGMTYYWTVRPFDQCTFGSCLNDIGFFHVNHIPKIRSIPAQKARVGSVFRLRMTGSDNDTDDSGNLVFSIISGPEGIHIDEKDGTIQWKPGKDQVGNHLVVLSVSDGMDSSISRFDIEVASSDESGIDPIYLGMAVLAILFIIIIILQVLILTRKKPLKEQVIDREETARDIRKIVKETADDLERIEVDEEQKGGDISEKVEESDIEVDDRKTSDSGMEEK